LGGESLSPSAGIVFARWSSGVRIWTPAPTQESTWVGLGERDRGRGGRFRAGLGNGTCPQSAGGGLPPRPGPAAGPAALLSCRFCFLRRLRVGSEEDVSWFWGSQPSPAQQLSFFLMGRQLVTHLGLVAKPMDNYVLGRRHARGGQHTARHVSQPLPVDQSAAAVAADRRDLTRPG
jgi:hypothetical protein